MGINGMEIDVKVAAGAHKFLENSIGAHIDLAERLQPHPADLRDMNFAVPAALRQRSFIPAIFWEQNKWLVAAQSCPFSPILHLQVAAANRVSVFKTKRLRCDL